MTAFNRLAHELLALGAPTELARSAHAAATDEVRHARMLGALDAGPAVRPRPPETTDLPCRDLFAVALENAIEGCVFETYGALVATFQAASAPTQALRRIFRSIAADERRHAALAMRVHAWTTERLSPTQASELDACQREAVQSLRAELAAQAAHDEGPRALGLPTREQALALCDAYFAAA